MTGILRCVFDFYLSVNVTEISLFTEQRPLHSHVKISAIVIAGNSANSLILMGMVHLKDEAN